MLYQLTFAPFESAIDLKMKREEGALMTLALQFEKNEGHTEDRTRVAGFRVLCATTTPYDRVVTVYPSTAHLDTALYGTFPRSVRSVSHCVQRCSSLMLFHCRVHCFKFTIALV